MRRKKSGTHGAGKQQTDEKQHESTSLLKKRGINTVNDGKLSNTP
jgi:hypothetical protein